MVQLRLPRTRKETTQLFVVLLAAGVSVAGALALAQRQREKKLLKDGPRRAPKKSHKVLFGKVDGENRGPDVETLIDPPLELDDPYFWLRDDTRKNPEILNLIKEENQYTEAWTRHSKHFQQRIYKDLLRHMKQTDASVPYPWGGNYYYSRTVEGKSYPYICRRCGSMDAVEETILDLNALAKREKYLDVGEWSPAPSSLSLLAYSVDTTGYETYEIRFKALQAGSGMGIEAASEVTSAAAAAGAKDLIPETSGSFVWGNDCSTLFYEKLDASHRPYQLWRHTMGTPTSEDVLLFTEEDERLWMGIDKTDSGRFLILSLSGKQQNETWVMDLQGAKGAVEHAARALSLVEKREVDVRYSVEHHGEYLYIITNNFKGKECLNSMLVRAPIASPGAAHWEVVFAYEPNEQVKHLTCFRDAIVIHGRAEGYAQFWIYTPPKAATTTAATSSSNKKEKRKGQAEAISEELHTKVLVTHPESVYCIYGSHNRTYDRTFFRYEYSSPVTPRQTIEYDLKTGGKTVLKQVDVPHYDSSRFACERLEAPSAAPDRRGIPLSVVYKKSVLPQGAPNPAAPVPVFLTAYGSYGACSDPSFDSNRLALLERGVVYVVAHIRGGGEMGRAWYEKEGKFLTKKNTFLDFVGAAEHLVAIGLTSPDRLAISGGSAGGLLVTACLNLRGAKLFKAAVCDVPFCDVLCTMSDASIPLTVVEWEEWGNPNEKRFFDYIKSYCPVTNIQKHAYPATLVLGGLHDPRVAYWEPLKFTKKLREFIALEEEGSSSSSSNCSSSKAPLLLKIDMSSGHFSASDRYKYLREKAFIYAFVLGQLGVTE